MGRTGGTHHIYRRKKRLLTYVSIDARWFLYILNSCLLQQTPLSVTWCGANSPAHHFSRRCLHSRKCSFGVMYLSLSGYLSLLPKTGYGWHEITFLFLHSAPLFSCNCTAALLKCVFQSSPRRAVDLAERCNLMVNGCHLVCHASWSHPCCYILPSSSHWSPNYSGAWLIGKEARKEISWIVHVAQL